MKDYFLNFLFSIFHFLLPLVLGAQNIVFTASCDRTQVALGETVTLEVKVSGDISDVPTPELPAMDNLDVISTSRMQSISIVNRKATSEVSFVYTLLPRKVGKFTIGSCTMRYGNQIFNTEPIEIEVVKSKQESSSPHLLTPTQKRGGKSLFATLSVDKSTAYVNEQIIISFKFYQGVNLLSQPRYTPPSFTGFWKEELGQSSEYKIIEGKRYLVTEIRYAVFPTQPGEYTIGEASMTCQVSEDILDDFFGFSFGGRPEVVKSNSVKLNIIPLPTKGKPANFSGAVGEFSISAKLDNTKVHQHEPATFSFTVAGVGNIKAIETPELPTLPDVKIYHSGAKVDLSSAKGRISGAKTFSIILVSEREGRIEIPPVAFSYFDPTAKEYKTITTPPQMLTVLAGGKPNTYVTHTGQPIEILGKDIRYIKTEIKLVNEANYIYRNRLFFLLQLIPIFVLLISLKYAYKRERLLKDKAYARAVKAEKVMKKGLQLCNRLLKKGEVKEFYNEVYKTLTTYIGGKLNISRSALTLDIAINGLKDRDVSDETINKLRNIFSACDLAKYGLGNLGQQEMQTCYEELTSLIAELSKRVVAKL